MDKGIKQIIKEEECRYNAEVIEITVATDSSGFGGSRTREMPEDYWNWMIPGIAWAGSDIWFKKKQFI